MTPKEKAKELVDKFVFKSIFHMSHVELIQERIKAKQCALIAVDEIIQAMDNVMLPNPFKQYWNKVKQEIENL
jgi:hypothetical protein